MSVEQNPPQKKRQLRGEELVDFVNESSQSRCEWVDDFEEPPQASHDKPPVPQFAEMFPTVSSMSAHILPEDSDLLEMQLFSKLARGWVKDDVILNAELYGAPFHEKQFYQLLTHHAEWASVRPLSAPYSGASVSNLSTLFMATIEWYNRRQLWDIAENTTCLPWLLYNDGRNVWGKNELIAWGPKCSKATQSPEHIWPLAMASWQGEETFTELFQVTTQFGLPEFIKTTNGKLFHIGGRELPVHFFFCADWMSLIPALNNTSSPNSRPTQEGHDPCLCGLCGIRGSQLMAREQRLDQFPRMAPSDMLWQASVHLFDLPPGDYVWEPLHCLNRCLQSAISFTMEELPSEDRVTAATILSRAGRPWPDAKKSEHTLVIKEVCFFLPSQIGFHIDESDEEVLRSRTRSKAPEDHHHGCKEGSRQCGQARNGGRTRPPDELLLGVAARSHSTIGGRVARTEKRDPPAFP